MSQLQVTGEAKIRDIQGPVVANSGVVTALDGAASQYVRGDGTLADFPTSSGGGSSVSYYLNSSVSQGTIGGVAYRELSKEPVIGAGTDITTSTSGYIASYITDANDPSLLEVPGGNFNCEFYFSVNSNNHNPSFYAQLYKYDGTTFTLLGSSVGVPEFLTQGTTIAPYYFAIPVATAALTITDRLAIRIYVNVDTRVVTLHTENGHLCQVVTTFSRGLTSLNNLTRQVQFLGTGTSGTDFNIASSVATHTFNLPVASAANTGKLSSTDWSTFNNKIAGTGTTNYLSKFTSASAIGNSLVYDNGTNVIIGNGTTDIQGRLQVTTSAGALLLNTDNINFAILFRNTSSSNKLWDISSFNNDLVFNEGGVGSRLYLKAGGDVGIGNTTPAYKLDVSGTGRFTGELRLESTITNGTFTYTLPAATGTLALTSQLTSGTVTSVGLSSATSGVTIGSSPITTSGTITLAIATASGSVNGLLSSTDWTTFNNKLSPATADATYVSLSANQTVGGFKTFSQAIKNESGILLKHNVISGQVGYTGLGGYADGLTVQTSGSIFLQSLFFQSAGSYTYTFPASTGTIALTSNLSAYLPLAGGTLTGALSGTSATFSSTVTANSLIKTGGTSAQILAADGSVITAGTNITISGGTISSTGAITGSGTTNYVTKFTGASSIGNSLIFDNGTNVGIGQISPSYKLDVQDNGVSGIVDVASFSVTGNGGSGRGVGILIGAAGSSNSVQVARLVGYQELANPVAVAASFAIQVANASGTLTERLRITQAGNLLIGSTTDNGSRLQVTGAATFTSTLQAGAITSSVATGNGSFYINNASLTNKNWTLIPSTSGAETDLLFFYTGASAGTRMTITNGGNVGIGTSTPTTYSLAGRHLELNDAGGGYAFYHCNTTNVKSFFATNESAGGSALYTYSNHYLGFGTNNTERMRITSSGQVLIGQTAASGSSNGIYFRVGIESGFIVTNDIALQLGRLGSTGDIQSFYSGTTRVGTISVSSTNTSYNTSSDYRLKEDLKDYSGLDIVGKIKTYDFAWKIDKSRNYGVIAHEVAEVMPYVVMGEKDGEFYQGVDYSKLVPILIKSIQELQAKIVTLESKIN